MIEFRLESPATYFLHLPKTAGSSLRLLFQRAYSPGDVISLHHPSLLGQVTLDDLQRFRCYLCHFGIGLYDLIGRTDLLCVTMLRDPVERAASLYHYHQRMVQVEAAYLDPAYIQLVRPVIQGDPQTWLSVPVLEDQLRDVQTRQLGISIDWRALLKGAPPASAQPLPAQPPDMRDVTAAACRQLEEMAVVGITERFDESMEMICAMLGIPKPGRAPRANIGPQKGDVDPHHYRHHATPEFLEQIRAINIYDQQLYDYACELFERQLARHRAARARTYSLAPRLRYPIRQFASAAWQQASRALPELGQEHRLRRLKSWVENRL